MPRRRIKQGGEAGALGGSGLAERYMERLEKTHAHDMEQECDGGVDLRQEPAGSWKPNARGV